MQQDTGDLLSHTPRDGGDETVMNKTSDMVSVGCYFIVLLLYQPPSISIYIYLYISHFRIRNRC